MMTPAQMDQLREAMSIRAGHEWDKFEGLKTPANELQGFLDRVPFATKQQRRHVAPQGRGSERARDRDPADHVDAVRLRRAPE